MTNRYFHIEGYSKKDHAKIFIKLPFQILDCALALFQKTPKKIQEQLCEELGVKEMKFDCTSLEGFIKKIKDFSFNAEDEKQKIRFYCNK